jgi:sigma-B regulation protein RsbU (phosphoserine phosphatase)
MTLDSSAAVLSRSAEAGAPLLLVADDQADVLIALELLLRSTGYRVRTASSPRELLAAVEQHPFEALLMDLNYARDTTSGQEGLQLLQELHERDPELPIVVMTAWGSIALAVEAMRRGARDFVLKPWDNAALAHTLSRNLRPQRSGPEHDLRLARRVQARLLPQAAPSLPGLECAALCREAGAVGGDYYDFLHQGPDGLGMVLADISGKGVAGALLMAHLQASLRAQGAAGPGQLPAVLRAVNRLFFECTATEHYATLFAAAYDARSHHLLYANCGHLPPLLLRAGGELERLPPTASVIGMLEDWDCALARVELRPGDLLLVYSDGVTEALNARGEEFGEERLLALARRLSGLSIAAMPAALLAEVDAFSAGLAGDDRTLLVARARAE